MDVLLTVPLSAGFNSFGGEDPTPVEILTLLLTSAGFSSDFSAFVLGFGTGLIDGEVLLVAVVFFTTGIGFGRSACGTVFPEIFVGFGSRDGDFDCSGDDRTWEESLTRETFAGMSDADIESLCSDNNLLLLFFVEDFVTSPFCPIKRDRNLFSLCFIYNK